MTEADWALHRVELYRYLLEAASDRKVRLFWCSWCRCYDYILGAEGANPAVEVAERFVENLATEAELRVASMRLRQQYDRARGDVGIEEANRHYVAAIEACCPTLQKGRFGGVLTAPIDSIFASRILEIFGNPFRPYPAPASWPSVVVELAQALYDGTGDRLVLADALEEAGHQELAEHFRAGEWHPKGCWAMDLVLGKS